MWMASLEGTYRAEGVDAMITLIIGWLLIFLAFSLQILNIIWAVGKIRGSQVVLVPVVFWYVAILIRGEPYLLGSTGLELGMVVIAHLVLTVMAHIGGRFIDRAS